MKSIFVTINGIKCTRTENAYYCEGCDEIKILFNWQGTAGLWYCIGCLLEHFDRIDNDN